MDYSNLSNLNIHSKNIYVFDFDGTLTDIHSGGNPDIESSYWLSEENKRNVLEKLKILKNNFGCKLFIVSRANQNLLIQYTNTHMPNLFTEIFGATDVYPTHINKEHWSTIKLQYVLNIMLEHNITLKRNIYYFDDEQINILELINNRFTQTKLICPIGSETLCEELDKLIYPILKEQIYDIDDINPNMSTININIEQNTIQIRKTSEKTSNIIKNANLHINIINLYTVHCLKFNTVIAEVKINSEPYFLICSGADRWILYDYNKFDKISEALSYVVNKRNRQIQHSNIPTSR